MNFRREISQPAKIFAGCCEISQPVKIRRLRIFATYENSQVANFRKKRMDSSSNKTKMCTVSSGKKKKFLIFKNHIYIYIYINIYIKKKICLTY